MIQFNRVAGGSQGKSEGRQREEKGKSEGKAEGRQREEKVREKKNEENCNQCFFLALSSLILPFLFPFLL
jgi:hypothetical protein